MDIYERNDWQMKDHDSYDTPLDWPENVFGEELGGGTDTDDEDKTEDETEPEPKAEIDE